MKNKDLEDERKLQEAVKALLSTPPNKKKGKKKRKK